MKRYLVIAALISLPVHAQKQQDVTVFDERIVVEVSSESQPEFDESIYWEILNNTGWKQAKEASKGLTISPALKEEIDYKESLERLSHLVKKRRTSKANALILAHPEWRTCDRIQWLWWDLKNESSTGYGSNAKSKYQFILDNCEGHELSTTQKLLSWTGQSAQNDILARYKASANYNAKAAAKIHHDLQMDRFAAGKVSVNELVDLEKIVMRKKDAELAELVAWKYLENQQPSKALEWFESAIGWAGPTDKRIEGKLLSLQKMGEQNRFQVEYKIWSKEYPAIAKWDIGSDEEMDLACEESTVKCLQSLRDKPELSAQEYALKGWKLYELSRPISAKLVFENAINRMSPADEEWDLTQYGYMLSLEQSGYADKADLLALQINDSGKRRKIDKQTALKQVYFAFDSKEYDVALSRIDEYETLYGKEVQLIEIKAWALYNSERKKEALSEFAVLAEAFPHDVKMQHSYLVIKCSVYAHNAECRKLGY
ncbi:hypothetical protein Q8W40_07270 [Vibrio penaeicida]|uniref:hypothetical protein n=1 Tax=Vibrio penaeicida TaxID=104609 RepID=UPI002735959F|nr:hypothetical protein [Vibrio penaeicida]MDP2571972.1 hypothetical protein [Vibrio penaeicida]